MQSVIAEPVNMTDRQFEKISAFVKDRAGINLHNGKKQLVKARLGKRLRQMGYTSLDKYLDFVESDSTGNELANMLDALSTNLTSFFREAPHFQYLNDHVLPRLVARRGEDARRLRIWSAGCSSGEEPYTIAMTVQECIPDVPRWDARVLATDLCTQVLGKARAGAYPEERIRGIPPQFLRKYFVQAGDRHDRRYEVVPSIRSMIHFARLNLMEAWPMAGPFDVIFCRNVMIYFDKATQERLVARFHHLLGSGGTLFVGHSESLAGVAHDFRYVQPTIYQKR